MGLAVYPWGFFSPAPCPSSAWAEAEAAGWLPGAPTAVTPQRRRQLPACPAPPPGPPGPPGPPSPGLAFQLG